MKDLNIQKVNNILDFASIYDEGEALWWIKNNTFPSSAKFRTIYVNREIWNKWVEENLTIVRTKSKMRANVQKLAIEQVVTHLKSD